MTEPADLTVTLSQKQADLLAEVIATDLVSDLDDEDLHRRRELKVLYNTITGLTWQDGDDESEDEGDFDEDDEEEPDEE